MEERERSVLSANAMQTLRARYLRRDESGKIIETPDEMFARVAREIAAAESAYGAAASQVEQARRSFYRIMAGGIFLPNSPALMNAGREFPALSACFVLPIDDSVEGIFESVKLAARIQKTGGGTGFSFDRLRPTGDRIASSGGRSSGPISFWRVFCEATRAIQQGAFRRGANMGMMSIDHPDILKFVAAKNDPSAFENFNVSVKVTGEFMSALRDGGDEAHVVVNPRTGERLFLPSELRIGEYGIDDLLPASSSPDAPVFTRRDVWDAIVAGAWATGEPGLCFIDRVNADNPTPRIGRIEATNPCGEQPLLDYEACTLGSINLSRFVRDGELNEPALRETVRLAVRFLDDAIDAGQYVSPRIAEVCRDNRKIGLGVMGFADVLFELGIRYDSDEGVAFGRRAAKLLTGEAFDASEILAGERGSFPNWAGSIWENRGRVMRNAALTTVAPTGTLSIIAGCSGGIEPVFALAFLHRVLDGRELLDVNAPFRRYAESLSLWSDDLARRLASGERLAGIDGIDERARALFVTAHDVAPHRHVLMQAAFQESIDGAISKTINLPASATQQDVADVYRLAWELGCKGVTVYRDGCRSGQPMHFGERDAAGSCPQCGEPLARGGACSRCPHCGCTLCA